MQSDYTAFNQCLANTCGTSLYTCMPDERCELLSGETVVQGTPAPLKVGGQRIAAYQVMLNRLGAATRLRLPVLMGITAET